MTSPLIITGTDTGVGKTIFSAALMLALQEAHGGATYWKPVQSGVEEVDTRTVQKLTALPDEHFLPETYILSQPLSPHRAAEIDGVHIDVDELEIPDTGGPLLIEGAGGLHVPLTRTTLFVDMFALWNQPVILCARTALGTINHTLLSVESLKSRRIPLLGIAFIGEPNPDNMRTIEQFTGVPILGRLPLIDSLAPDTLLTAFSSNFEIEDFLNAAV